MAEQQNQRTQPRASSLYQRKLILIVSMIVVVAGIAATLVFSGGTHRYNVAADESVGGSEMSLENVRAL